jgi:hypothetical protein
MNYRKFNVVGCAFCRNCSNLHPRDSRFIKWPFHSMKDSHGNLLCPMLKGLKCTDCGELGHTPRYCTNKPSFTLARYLAKEEVPPTEKKNIVRKKEEETVADHDKENTIGNNNSSNNNNNNNNEEESKSNDTKNKDEMDAERLRAEFAEADDRLWQYVDTVLLYCLDAPPQYAEWAWNKGVLLEWKTRPHQENFSRNVY